MKSILFIADKPEWAYHNIIKTWVDNLSEYDCYIAFAEDFAIKSKKFTKLERIITNTINKLRNKEVTYIIDKSRNYSYPIYKKTPVYHINTNTKQEKKDFNYIIEMGYYFQYYSELPFIGKKIVGIYTDSFPHEGPSFDAKTQTNLKSLSRKEFFNQYLMSYDGIIVGNKNLLDDYKAFTNKIIYTYGIYKQEYFIENTNIGKKEKLVIGWTGNPNRSMKGFKEVIQPAIEEIKKTGRKVELKTKFSGPYEDLFPFYEDVDLIAIASEADTGPSLFAEASLSGVPCISTKIGFAKMIIQDEVNGKFISRDINELKEAIIDLYDNREKLISFSKRIKEDYLNVLDNKILLENLKSFLKSI